MAVFADAHLGQVPEDGDDFLAALDDVAARGFATVVLLGDIFHYFIGSRKLETPLLVRVLEGWARLASRGVALRYVEGNRDFFLRRSPYVASLAAYGDADGLEVGGRRYAFVHGDRINTKDLPYRFWRRLSKNPVSEAALFLMPGRLARAIVARTERRLYLTNFKHKARLPVEALGAEARRARKAGYDEVVIGHFHREHLAEGPEGTARVLPAWLESRRHAEISPDGSLSIVTEPSAERAMRREAGRP